MYDVFIFAPPFDDRLQMLPLCLALLLLLLKLVLIELL